MGTLGREQCAFCPRLVDSRDGFLFISKVNWHPLCRECAFNPNVRAPFPSMMEKARMRLDHLSKNREDGFNKLPNSTKMAIAEYQHSNKELGTNWQLPHPYIGLFLRASGRLQWREDQDTGVLYSP